LRRAAFLTIFLCLSTTPIALPAQESAGFGGVQSFGFSTSYSGSSSHILIGNAEQRRIWTLGAEYTHVLHQGQQFRFSYEGSITPLFEETDPVAFGTSYTYAGQTILATQTPERITYAIRGPIGSIVAGNGVVTPIYALTGREDTYAGSISPLGGRITALPQGRIQPSFALNLGVVLSARDVPVDHSDQFNYMFALGPGIDLFVDHRTSWRLEYIYRHVSNAGEGFYNPGIDQGVIRVTLSLHR
jgi:hypothetical protein